MAMAVKQLDGMAFGVVLSVKNTFLEVQECNPDMEASRRRAVSCPADFSPASSARSRSRPPLSGSASAPATPTVDHRGVERVALELGSLCANAATATLSEHRLNRPARHVAPQPLPVGAQATTLPAGAVARRSHEAPMATVPPHGNPAVPSTQLPASASAASSESGETEEVTTVTIKNIPSRLLPEQLRSCLVKQGYGNSLALLHMPMKPEQAMNKGYAFVTFYDSATAARFMCEMARFVIPGRQSNKELIVEPAKVQGLEKNLEYMRSKQLLAQGDSPNASPVSPGWVPTSTRHAETPLGRPARHDRRSSRHCGWNQPSRCWNVQA